MQQVTSDDLKISSEAIREATKLFAALPIGSKLVNDLVQISRIDDETYMVEVRMTSGGLDEESELAELFKFT